MSMLALPRRVQRLYLWILGLAVLCLVFILAYELHLQSSKLVRLPKSSKEFVQPSANQVVLDVRVESCTWPTCAVLLLKQHTRVSALHDSWILVPKDLGLGQSSFSKSFLSYKVAHRDVVGDANVVVDIAVLRSETDLPITGNEPNKGSSSSADQRSRWQYRGHGIWVELGPYSDTAVTALTVLFGKDVIDPRPNWTLIKQANVYHEKALPDLLPYLSFRRGHQNSYTEDQHRPRLKANGQGKFKILQVSDLHFSTGPGTCLDPTTAISGDSQEECLADAVTLKFLHAVLDIERPDFVALSGDAIYGRESPDTETALYKVVSPFIMRRIPWALIMGNHDDEGSLDRNEVMTLAQTLPYSLAEPGPRDVEGVGNYVVTASAKTSDKVALSLFFLDTHKYSPSQKFSRGYDWIRHLQLNFVEEEAKRMLPSLAENPLAMAFIHIPIPEYRNFDQQPLIGQYREWATAPKYNTHARTVLRKAGVQVVNSGHDHCNDYCLNDGENRGTPQENHIWLCYGGAAGEGGYGGYGGYIRRMRIFSVDVGTGEIASWKRAQNDPNFIFDAHVLVSNGEVTLK